MSRDGILIVSASTGTGHLRAAEALREAAADAHPGVRAEHVDILEIAPTWVRSLYGSGYELMAVRAPGMWKGIYRFTDGAAADRARWAPLARRLLFREFQRVVKGGGWRAAVCTHFLPCQLSPRRPDFPPVALVMTDFTVHRYWVQRSAARHFVPTESAAAELRRRIPGARVEASGIPVSRAFSRHLDQGEVRASLRLGSGPVVVVTGGGLGIGVEETALAALAVAGEEVTVVAICGRNEQARVRLSAVAAGDGRLRVLGYVDDVERWLAAADLVAGKAGGLSCSEALALGKPLILTRPIPGAEEGNTRALVAVGAALAGGDFRRSCASFAQALAQPALLRRLASNARRLARPDAARRVVDALLGAPALETAA